MQQPIQQHISVIIVSVISLVIATIIAEWIKNKYFNKDETTI
jgi:hypothetical protein